MHCGAEVTESSTNKQHHPHTVAQAQVGYTLGSRTVYATLIEGRIVGSSERGGNENPVEGSELEGSPVPEEQYQERFWRRRLDGIGLDTVNKELLVIEFKRTLGHADLFMLSHSTRT
jgi:hypothetical protein